MVLFQDEETEALLAADFEIGHFFRERIVPKVMIVHVLCAQKWIEKLVPVWNPHGKCLTDTFSWQPMVSFF